jgi:hypothetical protein
MRSAGASADRDQQEQRIGKGLRHSIAKSTTPRHCSPQIGGSEAYGPDGFPRECGHSGAVPVGERGSDRQMGYGDGALGASEMQTGDQDPE